jgi:hypothetical protein
MYIENTVRQCSKLVEPEIYLDIIFVVVYLLRSARVTWTGVEFMGSVLKSQVSVRCSPFGK